MLRKLWNNLGLSARHIAERMGDGITRNAVLGKANRMKLMPRATVRSAKPVKGRHADGALAVRVKEIRNGPKNPHRCEKGRWANSKVPPTLPPCEAAPSDWLEFDQLKPHHCRWPAGEGSGIRFCGAPRWGNSDSYCEHHERLSRDPNQPRRIGGFSLNLKLGDRAA